MPNKTKNRLAIRNCICGRNPKINHIATIGAHPDRWQLKTGAICLIVLCALLYIVTPMFALGPIALLLVIAIIAALVKRLHKHTWWCAMRDGFLIGVAFFANALEALNPANWF